MSLPCSYQVRKSCENCEHVRSVPSMDRNCATTHLVCNRALRRDQIIGNLDAVGVELQGDFELGKIMDCVVDEVGFCDFWKHRERRG